MKKRLLSLVLCLVMVFSLFPAFGMNAAATNSPFYLLDGNKVKVTWSTTASTGTNYVNKGNDSQSLNAYLSRKNTTMTITLANNSTTESYNISFHYDGSAANTYGTVVIPDVGTFNSGSFSGDYPPAGTTKKLDPGGSIVFSLTRADKGSSNESDYSTLNLSGITMSPVGGGDPTPGTGGYQVAYDGLQVGDQIDMSRQYYIKEGNEYKPVQITNAQYFTEQNQGWTVQTGVGKYYLPAGASTGDLDSFRLVSNGTGDLYTPHSDLKYRTVVNTEYLKSLTWYYGIPTDYYYPVGDTFYKVYGEWQGKAARFHGKLYYYNKTDGNESTAPYIATRGNTGDHPQAWTDVEPNYTEIETSSAFIYGGNPNVGHTLYTKDHGANSLIYDGTQIPGSDVLTINNPNQVLYTGPLYDKSTDYGATKIVYTNGATIGEDYKEGTVLTNQPLYWFDPTGQSGTVEPNHYNSDPDLGILLDENTNFDGNLFLKKGLYFDQASGEYGIKLESWATGTVKQVGGANPTDIILILDDSDSMYDHSDVGGSGTRMDVLKTTVKSFLDILNGNGAENYRIAIIEYAGDAGDGTKAGIKTGTSASNALIELDGNLASLKATVDNFKKKDYAQYTYGPPDAFALAESILFNRGTSTRDTAIVFFTDGKPGAEQTDNDVYAINTIQNASSIKSKYDVDIYSIGLFGRIPENLVRCERKDELIFETATEELYLGDIDTLDDFQELTEEQQNAVFNYLLQGSTWTDWQETGCFWTHFENDSYYLCSPYTVKEYLNAVSSELDAQFVENGLSYATSLEDYRDKYETLDDSENQKYTEATLPEGKYEFMISTGNDGATNLLNAFKKIAQDYSSTDVTVNAASALKDTINTANLEGFSLANTSVSAVQAYQIDPYNNIRWKTKTENSVEVEDEFTKSTEPTPAEGKEWVLKDANASWDNNTVSATGFNYTKHFTAYNANKPNEPTLGYKLIVRISGLTPKKGGTALLSNTEAGIYTKADDDDPFLSVDSPDYTIPTKTMVIDFNVPMNLSPVTGRLKKQTGNNGTFELDETTHTLTYQLGYKEGEKISKGADISLSGTDSALAYNPKAAGTSGESLRSDSGWTDYIAVPASSVYFDDELLEAQAVDVGTGSSYNDGIDTSAAASIGATAQGGNIEITFTGSRIDAYCTTTAEGKSVTANLKDLAGTILTDKNGKKCNVTMKNQSANESRQNVPTVSFDMGDKRVGKYVLTLKDYYNGDYKLDGIRVYHPVGVNTDETALYTVTKDPDTNAVIDSELNARFVNLRALLAENLQDQVAAHEADVQEHADDPDYVEPELSTIAFFTDRDGVATISDYIKDGPKNEIYLDQGESIGFSIKNYDQYNSGDNHGKVMIGLSVQGAAAGEVTVNNDTAHPQTVSSKTDMYYKINPTLDGTNGQVIIKNTGNVKIAITNLKVTGVLSLTPVISDIGASTLAFDDTVNASSTTSVPEEFVEPSLSVNRALLTFAANPYPAESSDSGDTTDPEPTHTPLQELVMQLISNFVKALFNSIARLFGN